MRTTLKKFTTTYAESGRMLEAFWVGREIIPWRQMERFLRVEYFTFVRRNSQTDAEAARKLGLAPPNYYRMCKELGLK